jgi:3-deoxy-D-manno-octulosonic acid kinase
MNWRDFLDDGTLRDFVALEANGARALVRHGYEDNLLVLMGAGDLSAAEWVDGGRAAHPLVLLDGDVRERVLVRAYRRGGFIRHFNGARYFVGHRAYEELLATERARASGVRVPFVLAAAEKPGAIGYTAWLSTRWIEGVSSSLGWLTRGEEDRGRVLRLIGEQIARLHDAGVGHPDLNVGNILVRTDGGEVTILDFDRAVLYPGKAPAATRIANLRRLARSARKSGVDLGSRGWDALRVGYGANWPFSESPA